VNTICYFEYANVWIISNIHTHTHTHTHRWCGSCWSPWLQRHTPNNYGVLHCYYTGVTLLLYCCYTGVTLLLHCCYTVVTLLLHCCYTVVTLLLHCCHTVVTLLLHCCYTVCTLLAHCCYTGVTYTQGAGDSQWHLPPSDLHQLWGGGTLSVQVCVYVFYNTITVTL
jgi:hypothetical protein